MYRSSQIDKVNAAILIMIIVLGTVLLGVVVARADVPPKQCYQVCYPNGRCWTVCP